MTPPPSAPNGMPRAVLDSNVVLDWLVFRNPACRPLADAIETGRLHWLSTPAMRDELEHVLTRTPFEDWGCDPQAVFHAWERWAHPAPAPAPLGAAQALRCTDPDDQKFIDLALSLRVPWLFTRDRALLKLARRARAHGVRVLAPADWAGDSAHP